MSAIEYADSTRGDNTFPTQWGEPPSEVLERSAWILKNIHAAPTRNPRPRSAAAAMRKVEALQGSKPDYRRNARLALWRAEALARSSHIALARAVHMDLRRP